MDLYKFIKNQIHKKIQLFSIKTIMFQNQYTAYVIAFIINYALSKYVQIKPTYSQCRTGHVKILIQVSLMFVYIIIQFTYTNYKI